MNAAPASFGMFARLFLTTPRLVRRVAASPSTPPASRGGFRPARRLEFSATLSNIPTDWPTSAACAAERTKMRDRIVQRDPKWRFASDAVHGHVAETCEAQRFDGLLGVELEHANHGLEGRTDTRRHYVRRLTRPDQRSAAGRCSRSSRSRGRPAACFIARRCPMPQERSGMSSKVKANAAVASSA